MRMILSVMSLLFVVAIVGFLAKKQLIAGSAPPTEPQSIPASAAPEVQVPAGTPRQQMLQVQRAVQDAVQQARPMPDDN